MQDAAIKVENQGEKRTVYRPFFRIIPIVVLIAFGLACISLFPVKEHLLAILERTRHLRLWWGPLVLVLSFTISAVIPIPGSILAMASGFLFGPVTGTITAWIGATMGVSLAFSLGRSIARDWVAGRIAESGRLSAIDAAVGTQGFKIIMLLRLSSLFPFALLSYALGLTRASFWQHTLASCIGMFPIILAYGYLGSVAGSLADVMSGRVEAGPGCHTLLWAGLIVIFVVVLAISRFAGKAFKAVSSRKHIDAP